MTRRRVRVVMVRTRTKNPHPDPAQNVEPKSRPNSYVALIVTWSSISQKEVKMEGILVVVCIFSFLSPGWLPIVLYYVFGEMITPKIITPWNIIIGIISLCVLLIYKLIYKSKKERK